jgi:hypothetical protein
MQCFKLRAAILLSLTALLWGSIPRLSAEEGGTPATASFNQTYEQTRAKAQDECKALWSNHTFDWLRQKIPLGDEKPPLSMLTSKERLHPKDKPRADLAIKTLEQCRQANAPVYAMLPAGVQDMIHGLERRQDAVIAELYVGKITFGEFNVKWTQLNGEHFRALSGIPQTTPSPASSSASVKIAAPSPAPLSVTTPPKSAQTIPVATQPRRTALIIGNSNYSNIPKLPNPINDARSIDDSLRQIGFTTKLVLDASEQDIRREVRKFANVSANADIALVFYAGHGAQVNGENFLLPIDMEVARTEADIQLTGLKVDDLVNSIRSNTKVVFLDACRDNPALFKNLVKGRGAASKGLAPTVGSNLDPTKTDGGGVFIAYATEAGSIAEDGSGKHSPFTQALLRNLQKPISIDDMFSLVTKEVRLVTKNIQRPYKYASLENIVCLTGKCGGNLHSGEQIYPVEQAQRSESEELQIALQTNNPAALEAYLQKYPDSPKQTEVSETIAGLRRSEFNEWTQYELGNLKFPYWMQLSSIRQLKNRAAVRIKYVPDPALPLNPRLNVNDIAYVEDVSVFDCDKPIVAASETTIYSRSGEILHHYKWADPEYVNLSMGSSFTPGSIAATGRNIACHDDLRTPLLGKKQLAAMNFASLSSTVSGDGEMFYVPIEHGMGADSIRDAIVIIKGRKDYTINLTDGSVFDKVPKYRTEVDRVRLKCTSNESAVTKSEYFDESNKLVFVNNLIHLSAEGTPPVRWSKFQDTSPFAVLHRIVCPKEIVGIGVELAIDGKLIKVVRVIADTPAQKSGLKVNDAVTHLDEESVDGLTLDQVVAKMRGEANTKIKLRITREGEDAPIELSVTRGVVQSPSAQAPSVQWPSVQAPSVPWPLSASTPPVPWPSVQSQVQQ